MQRFGVLATAGAAVAIGLAPVVPLVVAHDREAFTVPTIHFYAVSATALMCAALAVVLGHRRHPPARPALCRDRRGLHGHGRAARRARPDDAGLPRRGRVHRRRRRLGRARGAARRRRHPRRAALAAARSHATCATSCYLQIGVLVATLGFGALALLDPDAIPSVPVALRPLVWWIVGINAVIYGVLALRALRTFQLTRRVGDLAVVAGLLWLAIAVATYLLSPVWSVGFWAGHVLELGAFLVISAALASDLARATPSRALHSDIDVQQRRHRGGGPARGLGRAAARPPRRQGHLDARAHAARRPARRAVGAAPRPARQPAARPRRRRAAARRRQAAGARRDPAQGSAADRRPSSTVIKRHPTDGAALLGHIGGFAGEIPLVRGHHERLDGSGYPDGLRGDELTLEVRILGVCDVYDALTSDRVYRRAYTQPQALTILDQARGSAFDSDVLDALSASSARRRPIHLQQAA